MYWKVTKIKDRGKRPPVPFPIRTNVDELTMETYIYCVSLCLFHRGVLGMAVEAGNRAMRRVFKSFMAPRRIFVAIKVAC
jgi:hypothetical protein